MRCPLPSLLLALALAACASPPRLRDGVPRVALDEYDALYVHSVGEGEPVLLVPGAAWLEADAAALRTAGRVVFVDLRGRGRSSTRRSPAAATLAGDVEDLERLRVRLGVERLSLLGWSFEAAVVLHYALAHPDRVERLVLVSPLPSRRSPWWDDFLRRYASRVTDDDLARIAELSARGAATRRSPAYHRAMLTALFRGFGGDPTTVEAMGGDPYPPPHDDPDAAALLRRAIHDQLGDWNWLSALAGLHVPVLIVQGGRSSVPRAAAEETAAALPNGRLLVLEEAAHFPWLEAPAPFFAAVEDFLRAR